MSELSVNCAHEQQEQKTVPTALEHITGFTIFVTAMAVLTVLVATAVYAQDKYSR